MDYKFGFVKNDTDISADMEERRVHLPAPLQAVTGTVCINCFGFRLTVAVRHVHVVGGGNALVLISNPLLPHLFQHYIAQQRDRAISYPPELAYLLFQITVLRPVASNYSEI